MQLAQVKFKVDRINAVVNILAHLLVLACLQVTAVAKFKLRRLKQLHSEMNLVATFSVTLVFEAIRTQEKNSERIEYVSARSEVDH